MAKISDLTAGSAVVATDLIPVVETAGVGPVKKTAAQLKTFLQKSIDPIAVNIVSDFGAIGNGTAIVEDQAFRNFQTWAQSQTAPIQLIIPPGVYNLSESDDVGYPARFTQGIKNLTIEAYGASIANFWLGGISFYYDELHSARLASVAKGDNTVTLSDVSQNTRFSVGGWVMVGALDLQGYGAPPNNHYFEYAKVTAINSGTGVITLDRKLSNSYKSTYPLYWAGGSGLPDEGGPATLYACHPYFDTEITVRGLRVTQAGAVFGGGRKVVLEDCVFEGLGPTPSGSEAWRATRCDLGPYVEIDKLCTSVVFEDCTTAQIDVQSSSIERMVIDGSRIALLNGTAKNTIVKNSAIAELRVGCTAYGASESLYVANSRIITLDYPGRTPQPVSDFSYANGRLTKTGGGPVTWAVPGARVFFSDSSGSYNYPPAFTVLDVRQNASDTIIDTTLPPGSLPAPSGGNSFRVHPCPRITVVNSSGCGGIVDASNAPNDSPLYSYVRRLLTGNIGQAESIPIWGNLAKVRVNVIRAYTGAQSACDLHLAGQFGRQSIAADLTTFTWDPIFNLKIAGERIITPGSVIGAQSGDAIPTLSFNWCRENLFPYLQGDLSGDSPSAWPIVEIEVISDQAITSVDVIHIGSTVLSP